MKQSKYFIKTSKTVPGEDTSINAKLLEQAGFINKTMAGVYSYLPMGLRVLTKIEKIIREEMDAISASELFLPALQPKENWLTTGRWETVDVLFKLKSAHDYELALGATHEEIVTPLVARYVSSYREFPVAVYQIQTKFRDEARAKSGILRGREFRMKDLYSFHTSEADFQEYYNVVAEAYLRIFNRLGLDALYTEASGGSFSKFSHEFQVVVPAGEDTIYICNKCSLAVNKEVYSETYSCGKCSGVDFKEERACEVGNIFPLKTKFTDAFGFKFTDEEGKKQDIYMGCYGIGSTRAMGVIVEKYADEKGLVWPKSVAPFAVHLLVLSGKDSGVKDAAENLYRDLIGAGIEVLLDDREVSAGEKFADSDLIGIPVRLVISSKTMEQGAVEYKSRTSAESSIVPISGIIDAIQKNS